MSLPVRLTPEATREAEVIRDYLNAERSGYGQVFLGQLWKTLERIGDFPRAYCVLKKNVRAARLHQFLYVVYYRRP